ncbi:hypothetical protein QQZ08_004864 [Neonectria magnoliae]|uniref:Uncharacterized protein n=1 Tax=Neonectria magnoliae TaxID=2732573 RepID=A0ABR1I4Y1_9HYPO
MDGSTALSGASSQRHPQRDDSNSQRISQTDSQKRRRLPSDGRSVGPSFGLLFGRGGTSSRTLARPRAHDYALVPAHTPRDATSSSTALQVSRLRV